MDLSNLSSDLPPTKPVNESSINDLNKDLTKEFKNAAKSVAALYRLSNTKNSLLRYKGYLDCLDDLLEVISIDGDVENWALIKKAELYGGGSGSLQNNHTNTSQEKLIPETEQQSQNTSPIENNEMPQDYDFTLSIPAPYQFHPSFPPLSINHGNTQYQSHGNRKNLRDLRDLKDMKEGIESKEEHSDDNEIDDQSVNIGLKRRIAENKAEKKPRVK